MSAPRGSKHQRAASTTSREPKRAREDKQSEALTGAGDTRGTTRKARADRTRKRNENEDAEGSDIASEDDDDGLSATIDEDHAGAKAQAADLDEEAVLDTSIVTRLQDSKAKKSNKTRRTNAVDSPSSQKRRVKKGKRDPFVTSPPGSKAKGKRVLNEDGDHEIGDEWLDAFGVRWRMGEDREPRREAVVVEKRLKYPNMPRDSRHPDAKLKVPVFVERFLTEQEYEDARQKKLLSYQEEERERDRAGKEEARLKELREEEEQRRRHVAESGRDVTTPRRIRNVQALFQTSPRNARASVSPMSGVLSYTVGQRSRSVSIPSSAGSRRMSLDSKTQTPMSTSSTSLATTSPRNSSQYKRLSLNGDNFEQEGSPDQARADSSPSRLPLSLADMPPPGPQSTSRNRASYRVPLVSPASPAAANRSVSGADNSQEGGILGRFSPLAGLVAKRKREEGLVKILQEEAERRKLREQK